MTQKISFCILILLVGAFLSAQSIFSFFGPADVSHQRDTHGEGMGGTGSGDLFRINNSLVNPALSTTIDRAYFSTALSMGNTHYRDNSDGSFRDNQAYLPYLNIVFPLRNHRFGFSYSNISSGTLDTENEDTTNFGNPENPNFTFIEEQRISFSLFNAGIFYANSNDIVNFGIGLNFLFGHRIRYSRQAFDRTELIDSRFEDEQTFKNPTLTIGLAKGFDRFSTGLAFSLPVELNGDSAFRTNSTSQAVENPGYDFPAQLTFGLTWKAHELLYLSSDIDYQLWEGHNVIENAVNTLRVGAGISWSGVRDRRNFLTRIPLRAGISHRNLPFEINDHQINELTYHFGFSFPLRRADSYLDFAIKVFERGDANKHGYEENGFLITIGTQGFDFIRRPANRKAPRDIPTPDSGRF